jgi:RNA recognition motif-containing protein
MDIKYKKNSIVILNIPYGISRAQIRDVFSKYGKIISLNVNKMKSNFLMCYIKYNEETNMLQALEDNNRLQFNGKIVAIKRAFEKLEMDNNIKITVSFKNDLYNKNIKSKVNKSKPANNSPALSSRRNCDDGLSCKCKICTKLRVVLINRRLLEVSELYKRAKTKSINHARLLSIKLMELKINYIELLKFFHHNTL